MTVPLFQAAPTNSFLQEAHADYFAKHGVPPPGEEEKAPGISPQLLNKQKWKILKTMPGKHQGNTWPMMSAISKGLAPMNKSAGFKISIPRLGGQRLTTPPSTFRKTLDNATQQTWDHLKAHRKGYGISTVAVGAGLYGDHQLHKAVNNVNNTISGGMETIQNTADNAMNRLDQQVDSLKRGPWTDMFGSFGSALAGLFGVKGYAAPNWYNRLIAFLKKMFGQQEPNKFTDPETGTGGVTTASYDLKKKGSMFLPANQALITAINGSPQFQKQAAAGKELVPEQVLNAHIRVADMMEKAAAMMQDSAEYRSFADSFIRASQQVRQGYPAKLAMYRELCGSRSLTAKANEVLDTIGAELLGQAIQATLAKKTASFFAKK